MLFPNFQAHSDLGPGLCGMGSSPTMCLILVGNSMKLKDPVIFQKHQTSKLPCPDDLSDLSFSRDLVSSSQDLTTDGTQITVVSHYAAWYAIGWPGYSATAVPFQQKGRLGSAAWRDTVPLMVHGWVFFPNGSNGKWLEKTIHPVLYMPVSLAVNIHVVST